MLVYCVSTAPVFHRLSLQKATISGCQSTALCCCQLFKEPPKKNTERSVQVKSKYATFSSSQKATGVVFSDKRMERELRGNDHRGSVYCLEVGGWLENVLQFALCSKGASVTRYYTNA